MNLYIDMIMNTLYVLCNEYASTGEVSPFSLLEDVIVWSSLG